MADKADQALKLAQKVEKDFQKLEKDLKTIEKNFGELTDMHNAQNKRLDELDKKFDAQNQQAKTSRTKFSEFTVK
jgi:hypothetical protein